MRSTKHWRRVGGTLGAITLVVAMTVLGTNGVRQTEAADPAIEASVTATVQSLVTAYNNRDFGAVSALMSDEAFEGLFFVSKEEAASDPEFFSEEVELDAVYDIKETATGATATAAFAIGLGIDSQAMVFLYDNLKWTIVEVEATTSRIPSGAKVVDMGLQEFAFVYDKAQVASGNFALDITNIGRQEHEVVLVKVDPATTTGDLLELAQSEEEEGPPPFEAFGFLGFLPPGESSIGALSEPLSTGKYFFLCFVPDTDGVPHAAKGMISEFTVGNVSAAPAPTTSPGGTISPPSTGDAGLVSTNSTGISLASLALVALALGLGARKLAHR